MIILFKTSLSQPEPPRTIFHPHANGIFDMKWSPSDSLLATCSGDQSTCVSCPITSTTVNILRGHTSTVKSVAWDPNHSDLLSTGGRDGAICMWDLRVGKRKRDQSAENVGVTNPVLIIPAAHGGDGIGARLKGRKGKSPPQAKSVTSLAYLGGEPYRLISSGSCDGYVAKLANLLRFRHD